MEEFSITMTTSIASSDTRDLAEHYDQTSNAQFENGIHLISRTIDRCAGPDPAFFEQSRQFC